jgi:glycosyltransferase involved in cell wall biosynthesis
LTARNGSWQDADMPAEHSEAAHAGTKPRVVIVMPAFNAAKTLPLTLRDIPPDVVDETILVDDASADDTTELARTLGLHVIKHPHNVGYGGNQKTCYMEALRRGADVVIMVHPDNQYDPSFIPEMLKPITGGEADIVFGSRMMMPGGARRGGMPLWKFIANRILTTLENALLGTEISDAHTGYRAYSSRFLRTVPFMRNSNDFVFDTQIIVQARAFGFAARDVPVTTKYFPEASSVNFRVSTIYGLKTLGVLVLFALSRLGVYRAKFLRP